MLHITYQHSPSAQLVQSPPPQHLSNFGLGILKLTIDVHTNFSQRLVSCAEVRKLSFCVCMCVCVLDTTISVTLMQTTERSSINVFQEKLSGKNVHHHHPHF